MVSEAIPILSERVLCPLRVQASSDKARRGPQGEPQGCIGAIQRRFGPAPAGHVGLAPPASDKDVVKNREGLVWWVPPKYYSGEKDQRRLNWVFKNS